jgi:glycosyltransferase involved in cell wall biosynthesis
MNALDEQLEPTTQPEERDSIATTILFLNPTGQIGGAEVGILALMEGLRKHRPTWKLRAIVGDDGPFVARARASEVEVEVASFDEMRVLGDAAASQSGSVWLKLRAAAQILLSSIRIRKYAKHIRSRITSLHPDIIHTTGMKMHLVGALASGTKSPLIWHVQDFAGQRTVARRLLRHFRGSCAAAVAISESVARDLRAVCRDAMPVFTVGSGVDTKRFSPEGQQLDLDALSGGPTAPEGVVRVGLVGTFAQWKGHAVFLRAIAQLPRDLPVRAYIIGGPIYRTPGSQHSRQDLAALADELGITDRVFFTGFISDTASAMRSLDVLVHASTLPEPFGMVLIEGQATGLAVIASNAGGAAEIVRDGVDGKMHPPGDSVALAKVLGELASDASLRERLGRAARRRVLESFHVDGFIEGVISVYSRSTSGRLQ